MPAGIREKNDARRMDREKQICGFLTKRINISVIFCKVKRT